MVKNNQRTWSGPPPIYQHDERELINQVSSLVIWIDMLRDKIIKVQGYE